MSDDVQRSLGRIEGKLDGIEQHILSLSGQKADHETRIRTLERWMWRVAGGTVVVLILFKLM